MGLDKFVTVTCDYSGCTVDKGRPSVVQWSETDVQAGKVKPPVEAQYLVIFTLNGNVKTFCGQLHAAQYFLPPGYEIKQKKVVQFPEKPGWKDTEGSSSQADGYAGEPPPATEGA